MNEETAALEAGLQSRTGYERPEQEPRKPSPTCPAPRHPAGRPQTPGLRLEGPAEDPSLLNASLQGRLPGMPSRVGGARRGHEPPLQLSCLQGPQAAHLSNVKGKRDSGSRHPSRQMKTTTVLYLYSKYLYVVPSARNCFKIFITPRSFNLPNNSDFSASGYTPKESKARFQTGTPTPMSAAALFPGPRRLTLSTCSPADEWVSKWPNAPNGKLFRLKKERNSDTHYNTDGDIMPRGMNRTRKDRHDPLPWEA